MSLEDIKRMGMWQKCFFRKNYGCKPKRRRPFHAKSCRWTSAKLQHDFHGSCFGFQFTAFWVMKAAAFSNQLAWSFNNLLRVIMIGSQAVWNSHGLSIATPWFWVFWVFDDFSEQTDLGATHDRLKWPFRFSYWAFQSTFQFWPSFMFATALITRS